MTKPTSLLAYSKHRGCTAQAVRKAVQSGRLDRSVVMVKGKPKIADVELADEEWRANTESRTAMELPDPDTALDDDSISFAEAHRRREVEMWRQARTKSEADELDLGVKRGELIPVAEARAAVLDTFTNVRTRLLGVPTRCKQRLASLSAADVLVIDDIIREALEELANADE